ncbi:hypothetical protein DVR14_15095 [Natrinema thermotolerans]|nr:hypothetical protein DVR14_15095 [Natrinema thermotolerans]
MACVSSLGTALADIDVTIGGRRLCVLVLLLVHLNATDVIVLIIIVYLCDFLVLIDAMCFYVRGGVP